MKKKLFAEMVGTAVLVLMGCGAAVINVDGVVGAGGITNVAAVLTIAFAFGLSVLTMCYTIGPISGCHINPAITLGVWLSGRMKGSEAGMYMVAQVVGALIGSTILYFIASGMGLTATGANGFAEGHLVSALIAETVFTCIFVLVVLGATDSGTNAPKFAGLAIGLALVLIHIVCIGVTGTSVNPARSIAPAIYAGGTALSQLWVFIVAPFVGAALAAAIWGGLKIAKK